MSNEESAALLEQELAKFRDESYADLVRRMEAGSLHIDVTGATGRNYQVQIDFFWDDRPGGNLRVAGAVDDSGWRALVPLCRDFIKAPDGSFVGE